MSTLEQVLDLLERGSPLRDPTVLVTFDDGYIDHYELAFPILQKHGVRAAFFLPTSFVGTRSLPWWDTIAYIVKNAQNSVLRLNYPEPRSFHLTQENKSWCIMQILKLYKKPSMRDPDRFLHDLEIASNCSRPSSDLTRSFLSWTEVRLMQKAGMAFGSHTHTHEVLSKLDPHRQREELASSRQILQTELRSEIRTLAYPVGSPDTFSKETFNALRDTGYRAAFSFYGGFNRQGRIERYDIRRRGVEGGGPRRLPQTTPDALSGC